MKVNGKINSHALCFWKTSTLKTIVIEPLPSLPIIKDLVVDMSSFFSKYEVIKPYLITNSPPPNHERIPVKWRCRKVIRICKMHSLRMLHDKLPFYLTNENFIGPAAMLRAYRYINDTRDEGGDERLDILDTPDGIWRCHTIFNCIEGLVLKR